MIQNESEFRSAVKAGSLVLEAVARVQQSLHISGKGHHLRLLVDGPLSELERLVREMREWQVREG